MGKYINKNLGISYSEKIEGLQKYHNAKIINKPVTFTDNLVCVVDNGRFAAAAYCYDAEEFSRFSEFDGRQKTWLIVPDANNLVD